MEEGREAADLGRLQGAVLIALRDERLFAHTRPVRPLFSFVILATAACGPSVATDDDDTTTDVSAETTGSPQGDTTSVSISDTSAEADTGVVADACVAADPNACPEECYRGYAWQVIDDACGVNGVEMCLPGGPKPGVPVTTYWARTDAGPVFLEYGGQCSAAARPDVWHECTGAVDEPTECACFCMLGYCPGDEDRRALDECGLDWACDPLIVDPQFGAVDHEAEACVLEGLGARTPGIYEVFTSFGLSTEATRFYVFGGDEVARIELTSDDVLMCPQVSDWSSASTCTLASPDYFAACLAPQPEGPECLFELEAWVTDCVSDPATCG